MKLNTVKKFSLFAIGLFIFVFVFYSIGIEKLLYQLSRMNIFYYSLSLLASFFTLFFWSLRWKLFIKSSGYKVSIINLMKILSVGMAINNVTPVAKLGGEPVRAYILRKNYKIPIRRGLATIISDLTTELLISITMVLFSIFLMTIYIRPPMWLSSILIIFIILSFVGLSSIASIYSNKKFISKVMIWIINKIKRLKPLQEKILRRYGGFQHTFRENLQDRKLFLGALLYGFVMKFFEILKFLFIFMALGYPIGILEILIALGISIMLLSIPATPGSLGIWEGGMISAFTLIGIPLEIAATVVFLERLIWFWGITVVGAVIGIRYGTNTLGNLDLKDIKTYA